MPFASGRLRGCQVEEVFVQLLKVLNDTNSQGLGEYIRKSHLEFIAKLKTLGTHVVQSLPWKKLPDGVVARFLRGFFVAHPTSRPTAETLYARVAEEVTVEEPVEA